MAVYIANEMLVTEKHRVRGYYVLIVDVRERPRHNTCISTGRGWMAGILSIWRLVAMV